MKITRKDIKDGMRFEIKNGEKYDIRKNWIYRLDGNDLRSCGYLNCTIYNYNDDLTHECNPDGDIVKVWDINGNLIFNRDKDIDNILIEECEFIQGDNLLIEINNTLVKGIFLAKLKDDTYVCAYKSSFNIEVGKFKKEDIK